LTIIVDTASGHYAPEVLLLQLGVVGRFDKDSLERVPCFKEKLGGALSTAGVVSEEMLYLFGCHIPAKVRFVWQMAVGFL